ncbi:MAG: hypothetical protein LUG58_06770, partial [Clostridiales bacterium]|nr:hypothetical protein [Clostridiales bacterium]
RGQTCILLDEFPPFVQVDDIPHDTCSLLKYLPSPAKPADATMRFFAANPTFFREFCHKIAKINKLFNFPYLLPFCIMKRTFQFQFLYIVIIFLKDVYG